MMARFWIIGLILGLSLCIAGAAVAEEKCMVCHGKQELQRTEETGRKIPMFVDSEHMKSTVHASRSCTDCHVDIIEIPHTEPKKVNCRRCHYAGNPVDAPEGKLYDQYEHSVHGIEVAAGNPDAPVCQDCHGVHDVIAHDSTTSHTYRPNIPKTCGHCHIDIYAIYSESVHGQAVAAGNTDSPVCSSCHGEHNIKRHTVEESTVSELNVSMTCSNCHGPLGVASKYGIKSDRAATYEDSFHGIAQIMENKMVANCASCHGYHDIRAKDDPKSSVNAANIPATCGKEGCHPEASADFASGTIHVDPSSEDSGLLYYISKGFLILTVSTLAGLALFILLDLFRRAKNARKKR